LYLCELDIHAVGQWNRLCSEQSGFFLPALEIPESFVIAAAVLGALFWSLRWRPREFAQAETDSANRQLATANQSLERSERKYRSIFESSRDAIFITSAKGGCLI